MRPAYEHAGQARQILNDAEDDLKDWQPELEDVPSHAHLDNNLMPSSASQGTGVAGSVVEDDSVLSHNNTREGEHLSTGAVDGSRVSSGTSVTTGQAGHYAPSEAETSQVA